mmetsp:Transcript_24829/g.64811  ORF Transcript_24829/g.64811 Transcript_24829/m.64811 type:complete len:260 (+) Transcript_24829:449-1228(+)
MATVELHGVVYPREALLRELVARVRDPPIRLHEHGRSKVILWVPPVGRARCHAAGAQDALVHAVQLGAVLPALEVLLLPLGLRVLALEPRLDGLVLVIEVREVGHEVLDNVRVGQRLDLDRRRAGLDVEEAREAVLAVDVHGARAADALAAGAAEGEGGVHLVLHLDEGIQDHRPAGLEVDRVLLQERLGLRVRVVPVDGKLLRGGHGAERPAAGRGPRRRRERRPQGVSQGRDHGSSCLPGPKVGAPLPWPSPRRSTP